MWEQIPLPEIKSTIRACSVPERSDSLAIWTDEGVFRVRLHPSPALFRMYSTKYAEKKFEVDDGYFSSYGKTFHMHGDCGRHGWQSSPRMWSEHPYGYTVEIDENENCVRLLDALGVVCVTVDSVNVKSRMLIANFSRRVSYRNQMFYFVVCDSVSLWVYFYRPDPEGVLPKWGTRGSRESQQSLWNAVIENPDDDAPRLIYADWLEENGDRERAEFIRLQCRIAERESREFILPDDPDFVLNDLMETQHGLRWAREVGQIKGIFIGSSYWRGFPICTVHSTSLATRKRNAQTILAASPLEFVSLYFIRDYDVNRLEKWILLSRFRNVNICSMSPNSFPNYIRLFKSKQLTRIRTLKFTSLFDQELNLALINNGPFPQLHTIVYKTSQIDNPLTDYSVLRDAKGLPNLKTVIFNDYNEQVQLQGRNDIRQLASRVENVYQILRVSGKPDVVTKLHA